MDSPIPTRRAVFLVVTLWLAGLGAAAQFAKIGVPFAMFEARFPDAGASVGWLLSLVSLIGAIFGMVAGVLINGFGLRGSLLAGLVLGGCISILQAELADLGPLLLSRVAEGVSHLIIVIAAPTLIAQIAPLRYRNLALTLWATFFGVAYALMAGPGMALIAEKGIPALFRLHGIYMVLCAAILLALLPRGGRDVARAALPSLPELLRAQLRACRSPWIAAPGMGWLFYTLTFVSLLAILPPLFPEARRDAMIGTLPLVSILSSLALVPAMLRVMAPTRVVVAGFAAAALSAALMLGPADPGLAAVALFVSLGIVQGASFAAVPALNDSAAERALSNGLLAQTGNIGNLLGTPLLLMVQGAAGTSGLIGTVIACYLLAILTHLWMELRRRAH